jgi:hypothetical protein
MPDKPDKKSSTTTSASSDETSATAVAEKGPGGSELGRASYSAVQTSEAVVIFAVGVHPTSGYTDFFEQSPIDIYPPEFIFRTIPPSGPVLQVLTPFAIWVMFGASAPVKTVTVHDADGPHTIDVQQPSKELVAAQQRATWISGSVITKETAAAMISMPTTMATGEEGGGPTTMAVGEEDITAPTTMATGEEGGPGPTTMATGEEESIIATTLALGEENPPITTLALGEESPFTTLALGEEGPITLAVGEDLTPGVQTPSPFGTF